MPAINYGQGEVSDMDVIGIYVEEQSIESLIKAMGYFETCNINSPKCKKHAPLFSVENFNKILPHLLRKGQKNDS